MGGVFHFVKFLIGPGVGIVWSCLNLGQDFSQQHFLYSHTIKQKASSVKWSIYSRGFFRFWCELNLISVYISRDTHSSLNLFEVLFSLFSFPKETQRNWITTSGNCRDLIYSKLVLHFVFSSNLSWRRIICYRNTIICCSIKQVQNRHSCLVWQP